MGVKHKDLMFLLLFKGTYECIINYSYSHSLPFLDHQAVNIHDVPIHIMQKQKDIKLRM